MDNRTWNVINSMNNMKSSFILKRSRNFGREKESTNSVKNMMKFSFGSTIFSERYLYKLVDEQCHRNARQLGKHIECTQEHYQIKKF